MTSRSPRRFSRSLKAAVLATACAAAAISGLALAGKPGGGGGKTTTWTVRLQGICDSIMQGYNASCTGNTCFLLDLLCYSGGEQPENSYFDGTSSAASAGSSASFSWKA